MISFFLLFVFGVSLGAETVAAHQASPAIEHHQDVECADTQCPLGICHFGHCQGQMASESIELLLLRVATADYSLSQDSVPLPPCLDGPKRPPLT